MEHSLVAKEMPRIFGELQWTCFAYVIILLHKRSLRWYEMMPFWAPSAFDL